MVRSGSTTRAGPVDSGAATARELLAQRAGLHSGRPHLARARDAPLRAVLLLDREAQVVDVGHHRVELDLDAQLLQAPLCFETELGPHRREHGGRGVEQDHPAVLRLDRAERAGQGAIGELGNLTGDLDAGGARATTKNLSRSSRSAGRVTSAARTRRGASRAGALSTVFMPARTSRSGRFQVGRWGRRHDDAVEIDHRLHSSLSPVRAVTSILYTLPSITRRLLIGRYTA